MRRIFSASVSSASVQGRMCVNVEVGRLCKAVSACSCCLLCCRKSSEVIAFGCLRQLKFFLFHRRVKFFLFHQRFTNGYQSWCLHGSALSFCFVLRVWSTGCGGAFSETASPPAAGASSGCGSAAAACEDSFPSCCHCFSGGAGAFRKSTWCVVERARSCSAAVLAMSKW